MHDDTRPELRSSYVPTEPDGDNNGLQNAVQQFVAAAEAGQCQPICSAWSRLRSAARGMRVGQVIELAAPKLEPQQTSQLLVKAHRQLTCYMCGAGIVTCEDCGGTGLNEDGRKCTHCDGRGIAPCSFCRGTGWADMDLIPAELRGSVIQHRYQQVKGDIKRLGEFCGRLNLPTFVSLDAAAQKRVLSGLLLVHSRCTDLAESPLLGDEQQNTLQLAAGKIDQVLNRIRTATTEGPAIS
jgi:hypothetical protein